MTDDHRMAVSIKIIGDDFEQELVFPWIAYTNTTESISYEVFRDFRLLLSTTRAIHPDSYGKTCYTFDHTYKEAEQASTHMWNDLEFKIRSYREEEELLNTPKGDEADEEKTEAYSKEPFFADANKVINGLVLHTAAQSIVKAGDDWSDTDKLEFANIMGMQILAETQPDIITETVGGEAFDIRFIDAYFVKDLPRFLARLTISLGEAYQRGYKDASPENQPDL